MDLFDLLKAHLLNDVAIAALVVQRVTPGRLPQKTALPAIVCTRISGIRHGRLRGMASLASPRWQVDSWAQTYADATRLGALCRQRLEGFTGTWTDGNSPETVVAVAIEFANEQDLIGEDILGGLFRHSADYFISHQTAGGTL